MNGIQVANQERLYKVILGSHVSEKSSMMTASNRQYAFKVLPCATKCEIKHAVEHLFNVKVDSVQILNVKGKYKRYNQRLGRRKDTKKAYVRLQDGHSIDLIGQE